MLGPSILDVYLPKQPNETWKAVTARNSNNEATATQDKPIKIFWRGGVDIYQGEAHLTLEGWTKEPIKTGDFITYQGKDRLIQDVKPAPRIGGGIVFYKVFV